MHPTKGHTPYYLEIPGRLQTPLIQLPAPPRSPPKRTSPTTRISSAQKVVFGYRSQSHCDVASARRQRSPLSLTSGSGRPFTQLLGFADTEKCGYALRSGGIISIPGTNESKNDDGGGGKGLRLFEQPFAIIPTPPPPN